MKKVNCEKNKRKEKGKQNEIIFPLLNWFHSLLILSCFILTYVSFLSHSRQEIMKWKIFIFSIYVTFLFLFYLKFKTHTQICKNTRTNLINHKIPCQNPWKCEINCTNENEIIFSYFVNVCQATARQQMSFFSLFNSNFISYLLS